MNRINIVSSGFRRMCTLLGVSMVLTFSLHAAPVRVVTTTGMVGDMVSRIGGDQVLVDYLMGPGVDPHLYKATASDVRKLQRAQVIFYNGLFLEGKMQEIFERMARGGRSVVAITHRIDHDRLIHPHDSTGHPDPHIWFDTALWAECIAEVVEALQVVVPAAAHQFAAQGQVVREEMQGLHEWVQRKVAELPAAKRILVTSHDAYGYFGRAYGFQVVGLQGISTVSEAALADMARLVDFIEERDIQAIFVETSVPHATIERIATDADVAVGGELFSDAMGTPGQIEHGYDLGTYEGMVRHNVTTIVDALK